MRSVIRKSNMSDNTNNKPRGGRQRTGSLLWRRNSYYARLTVDVDGVPTRVIRALGTDSKQVARAKLKRLLKAELGPEEASRGETFEEAARRVVDANRERGMRSVELQLARLAQHVFPVIGTMLPRDIRARHLNDLLEGVRVKKDGGTASPSRQTLKHVLSDISVVLDDLWRKEELPENVSKRVRLPKTAEHPKERAVLTDFELARYLTFQHPDERHQVAVLERQTMSCIARLFGGVRTGDLHVMRWESLDAANGRFEWGYAPRSKTENPQRLAIDEMLRPILRDWWKTWGCPLEGLVFPALRDGKHSEAGKGEKHQVSHSDGLRRDLRRAFGVDAWDPEAQKFQENTRAMTPRELELFEGTDHTLPVDFHSWRRAYCQALADAGVNAQQAKALAGHSTEEAHERYLRSSEKTRHLPTQARPQVDLSKVQRKPVQIKRYPADPNLTACSERETRIELATPSLGSLCSTS
jgi:integrase